MLDVIHSIIFSRNIPLHQISDQGFGILLVKNRKSGLITKRLVFPADNIQAKIVEGGYGQTMGGFTFYQLADTFLHFP